MFIYFDRINFVSILTFMFTYGVYNRDKITQHLSTNYVVSIE